MQHRPEAFRMNADMQCGRCKGVGVELLIIVPDKPWRFVRDRYLQHRFAAVWQLENAPVEARCPTCGLSVKLGPIATAVAGDAATADSVT